MIIKLWIYENHIWKPRGEEIIWKKIIAVIDATFAVAKREPEKIQACTGFEHLTPAIPVQRSTNWAHKPSPNMGVGRWIGSL